MARSWLLARDWGSRAMTTSLTKTQPSTLPEENHPLADAMRETQALYLIEQIIRPGQRLCNIVSESKKAWPIDGVFDPQVPFWRNLVRKHVMDKPAQLIFRFVENPDSRLDRRIEHVRLGVYYGGTKTGIGDGCHKVLSFALDVDTTDREAQVLGAMKTKAERDAWRKRSVSEEEKAAIATRLDEMLVLAKIAFPGMVFFRKPNGKFHGHANLDGPVDANALKRWVESKLPPELSHVEVFPKTADNAPRTGYHVGNQVRLQFNPACPYLPVDGLKPLTPLSTTQVLAKIEAAKGSLRSADIPKPELSELEKAFAAECYCGVHRCTRIERFKRYLGKYPVAVSGDHGHNRLLTACARRFDFGVSAQDAFGPLVEYSKRCDPPWSDSEIWHKLQDAKPHSGFPPGCKLTGAQSDARAQAVVHDSHNDVGLVALGTRDPKTGRLVLSPRKTLPTAEAFIKEFHSHPDGRTFHSYAGILLTWRGNRFVEIEEETLRQKLQPWLHAALRYVSSKPGRLLKLVDFESNPGTIEAALESIRAYAHLPATLTPPAWLSGDSARPDPRDLLPCLSGNLDIRSGQMLPPTPGLFNISALDFDYNPNAKPPERWIKFLGQLWDDDLESISLLQEWAGYCLVPDTSQQKIMLLEGPKRSGKGTVGRLLTRLVGTSNVVGPTTSSLAGPFGLQPLIGKSLAIVSDARFTGENIGVVVERLLCISGEDALTVDRKYLGSVTMRLPTRFMFLTNELPRLRDASGALAGRFVVLRLSRSFYGQEDVELTAKLMEELPGILLWAIQGLKRLRARGRFVQPKSVEEAVREIEDLGSPVLAFVREYCTVAPGHRVRVDDIYNAWKQWCDQDGRTSITSKQTFGRDLAAAVPGVVRRRGAGDVPFYAGIALKGGMS